MGKSELTDVLLKFQRAKSAMNILVTAAEADRSNFAIDAHCFLDIIMEQLNECEDILADLGVREACA